MTTPAQPCTGDVRAFFLWLAEWQPTTQLRKAKLDRITREVSMATSQSVEAIMSRSRQYPVVAARHAAMWLACRAGFGLREIGTYFDRDHGDVTHARKSIDAGIETSAIVRERIEGLTERLEMSETKKG
jgi:chromosomal replication initiation ATPase DnaA